MFDRLIDAILAIGEKLLPFTIVLQWELGIYLRFGCYKKSVGPGIHFRIPLMDHIVTTNAAMTTMDLPSQSLITADNKSIVLSGIVKYSVEDAEKFLVNIFDAKDVLKDTALGLTKFDVAARTLEECRQDVQDIEASVSHALATAAQEFGIYVDAETGFTITDMAPTRNIRILQDTTFKDTRPFVS